MILVSRIDEQGVLLVEVAWLGESTPFEWQRKNSNGYGVDHWLRLRKLSK